MAKSSVIRFVTRKWPPAIGGIETYSVKLSEALLLEDLNFGGVAERSNAAVLKTVEAARPPRVRIPPSASCS